MEGGGVADGETFLFFKYYISYQYIVSDIADLVFLD